MIVRKRNIITMLINLVILIALSLTVSAMFSRAYAYDVNYILDNFRIRFAGIIDFETNDKEKYLPALLSINSDFFIPDTSLKVSNYDELQEADYYISKISQQNIRCHVAFIYSIQDTKWAYVSIDEEPGLFGWVCTDRLRFDTPENNSRYYSLAPSQSTTASMLDNMKMGFSLVTVNNTNIDSSSGTVGDFEEPTIDNNGRNPIVIEAPKPYYELQDIFQFLITIILSLIIAIIAIYTYTAIWGESPSDTIYLVVMNGFICVVTWAIVVVRLIFILRDKGVIETTDISIITTVLITVSCLSGGLNIDSTRVGRPILYTACLNLLIVLIISMIMVLYSYYVGILNFWDTFVLPIFKTLDSFIYFEINNMLILVLVALYNRYTFSYTEERARIRTIVKARYAVAKDEEEVDEALVLQMSVKKKSFLSILYDDGLPTLNDFLCEMRNRAKGLDR